MTNIVRLALTILRIGTALIFVIHGVARASPRLLHPALVTLVRRSARDGRVPHSRAGRVVRRRRGTQRNGVQHAADSLSRRDRDDGAGDLRCRPPQWALTSVP